jgi:hypothetical protein
VATDRQQVDRMEFHHDQLLTANKLSLPPALGRMAIFTMYDHALINKYPRAEDGLENMDREARRIQRYLRYRGKRSVYFPKATIDDFWEALDDKNISDLTIIGLAQLGRIHISPWARESVFGKEYRKATFFDLISRSGVRPTIAHLKQGSLYQRTSGVMDKAPLNVPLGWGFMADRTKIWALPQCGFYPSRWHIRPQAGLVNVAEHFGLASDELKGPMSYTRIKEVFGMRESLMLRRYPVPRFTYPVYDRLRNNQRLHDLHDDIRRIIFPSIPT